MLDCYLNPKNFNNAVWKREFHHTCCYCFGIKNSTEAHGLATQEYSLLSDVTLNKIYQVNLDFSILWMYFKELANAGVFPLEAIFFCWIYIALPNVLLCWGKTRLSRYFSPCWILYIADGNEDVPPGYTEKIHRKCKILLCCLLRSFQSHHKLWHGVLISFTVHSFKQTHTMPV